MTEKVVLFGTGSLARDAYYDLQYHADHAIEVVAFTKDRQYLQPNETVLDLPVVPFDEVAKRYPPQAYKMLLGVGDLKLMRVRAEKYRQARAMGYELISSVSSRAVTWPTLSIGDNCQISAGAVINPSARIGSNVFIGTGCMIPHDVVIHDHCMFASGVVLSGCVTVGPGCFIGTGAVVRNSVTIGAECIIGAGALILQDAGPREVYMAEPSARLPVSAEDLFV